MFSSVICICATLFLHQIEISTELSLIRLPKLPQQNNHRNISILLDNLLRGYDNSIRPDFGGSFMHLPDLKIRERDVSRTACNYRGRHHGKKYGTHLRSRYGTFPFSAAEINLTLFRIRLIRWTVTFGSPGWTNVWPSTGTGMTHSRSVYPCWRKYGSQTRTFTMGNNPICTQSRLPTNLSDFIKMGEFYTPQGESFYAVGHRDIELFRGTIR